MGALTSPAAGSLPEALNRFASPQNISIRCMDAASAEDAMSKAGGWLRSWRAHGRTGNNPDEQLMPGFKWAKHDHDLGAGSLGHAHIYRAALGMPIVQRFTSSKSKTVTWTPREGERLASPVLLRPHKSGNQWLALFVFIHCQELPENTPVVGKTVGGRDGAKLSARISRELLLQMQNDERLRSF
jgi:hypothetical protein